MKAVVIRFIISIALFQISDFSFSQPVSIIDQKLLGGSLEDKLKQLDISLLPDLIAAGQTQSIDGNLSANHGSSDQWIISVDGNMNPGISQNYGGPGFDEISKIEVLTGGYAIAGSNSGIAGVITCVTNTSRNAHFAETDLNGNVTNQFCIGGSGDDQGIVIRKDPVTGEYLFAGNTTSSNDGDFTGLINQGFSDIYVGKLNSAFGLISLDLIGSSGYDFVRDLIRGNNGNWYMSVETNANDGSFTGTTNYGSDDILLLELNSNFGILNKYRFGGSNTDHTYNMRKGAGNSLLISGGSWSTNFAGCTSNSLNAFVMKVGYNGNLFWNTCIEGSGNDLAWSAIASQFGSYIYATGETGSFDLDFSQMYGVLDGFIAALNETDGSLIWTKNYGGSEMDMGLDIIELPNGNLMTLNFTHSADHDVSGTPYGMGDAWLVKFDNQTGIITQKQSYRNFSVHPNPVIDLLTIKALNNHGKVQAEIIDRTGRTVLCETIFSNSVKSEQQLSLKFLADGLYNLVLKTDNTVDHFNLSVIR